MKHFILFILFAISFFENYSQVSYSSNIPTADKKLFKDFEKALRSIPFTVSKNIYIDTSKEKRALDLSAYAPIFKKFFDTSEIKNFKTPQTSYMAFAKERNWLVSMSANNIIGIHNMLTCVKDSLLFVMPAAEYSLIDKDDDRVKYSPTELYVVGFKGGGFYYPYISIYVSKKANKIIYMNLLINFEKYPKEKQEYFDVKLAQLLMPCERQSDVADQNELPQTK